jgi:hypothetical protein
MDQFHPHPHLFTSHWLLVPMPPMVNQHNTVPSAERAEFYICNSNSMIDEDHNDEDSFCSSTSSDGA